MDVLAIIPARGGSKGIPGKNLVPLGGKPLIQWTIEAAQRSRWLKMGQAVVSTDDPAIRNFAIGLGVEVIDRPSRLARDKSPIDEVERHAIEVCGADPLVVVRLQPTSPLRTFYDIDAALDLMFHAPDRARRVVSVTPCREHPYLIKNAGWKDIIRAAGHNRLSPRQEYPPYYWINGAIYARDARWPSDWYDEGTTPYVMPRERSIDIDDYTDLRIAEALLGSV